MSSIKLETHTLVCPYCSEEIELFGIENSKPINSKFLEHHFYLHLLEQMAAKEKN